MALTWRCAAGAFKVDSIPTSFEFSKDGFERVISVHTKHRKTHPQADIYMYLRTTYARTTHVDLHILHRRMHLHTQAHMHTCHTCHNAQTHAHLHMHVYMYSHRHTNLHMYILLHKCTHIREHTLLHPYTNTQVYQQYTPSIFTRL